MVQVKKIKNIKKIKIKNKKEEEKGMKLSMSVYTSHSLNQYGIIALYSVNRWLHVS